MKSRDVTETSHLTSSKFQLNNFETSNVKRQIQLHYASCLVHLQVGEKNNDWKLAVSAVLGDLETFVCVFSRSSSLH